METTYSAGGVVLGPHNHILIVNQNHDSWSFPKGHIESGENAFEAAKREIEEESGIRQLVFLQDLGSYTRYRIGLDGKDDTSERKHLTFYLFQTSEHKLIPKDSHNPEARWVEQKQVAELLTHPKDKAFFVKIMPELSHYQ